MYNMEVLLDHYEEYGDLTESYKIELSKTLVSYFLHFKIWLGRKDFEKVTKLIVTEFPTEDPLFYYQPPVNGRSNPKGKLYHRYNNQTDTWRSKLGGVYKYNVGKPKNKKEQNQPGKAPFHQLPKIYCI